MVFTAHSFRRTLKHRVLIFKPIVIYTKNGDERLLKKILDVKVDRAPLGFTLYVGLSGQKLVN